MTALDTSLIYVRLTGVSPLPAGGRIYSLGDVPQEVTYPFAAYWRVSTDPANYVDGYASFEGAVIQIDCWDTTKLGAHAVAAAVISAMTGSTSNFTAQWVGSADVPETEPNKDLFHVALEFLIQHREA